MPRRANAWPARPGAKWPVLADCRIGVGLVGPKDDADLLAIDEHGVYWRLATGTREALVQFALYRQLIVWPTLETLVHSLIDGRCCGLLEAFAVQVAVNWDGGQRWFAEGGCYSPEAEAERDEFEDRSGWIRATAKPGHGLH